MSIEIVDAGLATSVQDLGRSGCYNVGIPPSGALDQFSARVANLLVGNEEGAAVLEAPYLPPKIRFTAPTVVAVAGATSEVKINGSPVSAWEAIPVQAEDELSFGFVTAGARVYIAIAGGIDVPEVLGSRSSYSLGVLGGLQGRTLQASDVLHTRETEAKYAPRSVPERLRPVFSKEVELRFVLGLYDYRLTDDGLSTLLESDWQLTPVADRTGFRYGGPKLSFKDRVQPFGAGSDPSNIVDAGYPIGSIQVPSGSEPIILHRDAVSGGGYAMVGTVINTDMDLVAQCAPGTATRLVSVSLDEALAARKDRHRHLTAVRSALAE